MENWCWQPEALAMISGHFETGEPLPDILLDRMLAARNFMSAMQMVRQLEFGIFDFRLHMTPARGGEVPVQGIVDQVRRQVAVINYPGNNRFQHAFSHIFAGGYAAGYYSYKWAEVLSADVFSRFKADGVFNRQTGERFLETILEAGGSREPMELFVDFMGREPDEDALLKQESILPAY
jgi:oligopeptidase A